MAVGSAQYTITSTASVIASAPAGPFTGPVGAVVILPDATTDVYLGGSNVSSTNGLKAAHGTALVAPITLFPGDVLYAVVATGTATVSVLQT